MAGAHQALESGVDAAARVPAVKVLVVDDTEGTRYYVSRTLRRHGFEVLESGTGAGALEIARRDRPDVVVLDVKLPDIHGFDVASQLRGNAETRSIAILHLSASYTAADARAEGLNRGADGYLTHPVDEQVLCATVDSLLRVRDAQRRERDARRAAEANEARYRFLAEAVPDMVWSTDGEGRLDYVNSRWQKETGLTLDEAAAWGWVESIYPADRERLDTIWRQALASGEPYEVEARQGNARAGRFRWRLIRAVSMCDERGNRVRWFGTCTDIEDLWAAQHERELLIARLREEDRRKTDFLSQLSHELRNPLAPIRNAIHILGLAAPGSEQASRAIQMIDRQTAQLAHVVDDLLDVSRVSRGKFRLRRERVDLGALVGNVGDDFRELFATRGIALRVDVDAVSCPVWGDPARLTQVIGNLLQNAAKFTLPGGRAGLSLQTDDRSAVICVSDDGAGIDRHLLERVFEPFVQAESTLASARGGLGLGLALVKALVEAHGGSVQAESEGPGHGARFTVRLPLATDAPPPADEPPSS